MKLKSSLATMLLLISPMSQSGNQIPFVYRAECTTAATGCDGSRESCASGWTTNSVPEGYVYAKDRLEKTFESANGSEHYCEHKWEDFVEVIPGTGIEQPRTLKIRARARSPRGNCAGRGWAKCRFNGFSVKVP